LRPNPPTGRTCGLAHRITLNTITMLIVKSDMYCKAPPAFSSELQSLLISGATILRCAFDGIDYTCLIRLPKGQFKKVEDGREFEYVVYDFDSTYIKKWFHASSSNDTKRGAIKRWERETEDSILTSYSIIRNRQPENA